MTESNVRAGRPLTQAEIDGYWRADFVNQVLDYITDKHEDMGIVDGVHTMKTESGRKARFIVRKNQFNLAEFEQIKPGEFEFAIGPNSYYSYHLSDVVRILEQIYDHPEIKIYSLNGEIQLDVRHPQANPDAEPSVEPNRPTFEFEEAQNEN